MSPSKRSNPSVPHSDLDEKIANIDVIPLAPYHAGAFDFSMLIRPVRDTIHLRLPPRAPKAAIAGLSDQHGGYWPEGGAWELASQRKVARLLASWRAVTKYRAPEIDAALAVVLADTPKERRRALDAFEKEIGR